MSSSAVYRSRHAEITCCASQLQEYIEQNLNGFSRVDRVSARAKSPNRFALKAEKKNGDGTDRYVDPLTDIQDQIGARIVCFYLSDVERVRDFCLEFFRPVEYLHLEPSSFSEFGYFGWHAIFFIPSEAKRGLQADILPTFFELQVKTLFQHAWSEAEHDLGYKEFSGELDTPKKRLIAFAAAQAWGADNTFQAILNDLNNGDDHDH